MNENFQSDVDLQTKNSFAVPSHCKWFLSVTDKHQLVNALRFARDKALPLHVLGGGTNVLLAEYLDALVARIEITGKRFLSSRADSAMVEVSAGENWHQFVCWTLEQGWYGLENLALIPGTCGAAPIQNIGAYGVELSEFLHSVEIYDTLDQQFKILSAAECELEYRDSIFKKDLKNRAVVVSLRLNLNTKFKPDLSYPALSNYLDERNLPASSKNLFDAVVKIRQRKLPDPNQIPNAGSFFKNPVVDASVTRELASEYPDMPRYRLSEDEDKIPAAWLIDQAGFKGWQSKGVGVHTEQALVLVNPGRKGSTELMRLAEKIQIKIRDKFGIQLEFEPTIIS